MKNLAFRCAIHFPPQPSKIQSERYTPLYISHRKYLFRMSNLLMVFAEYADITGLVAKIFQGLAYSTNKQILKSNSIEKGVLKYY